MEYAFERWALCFSFGIVRNEYILHIVDKSYLDVKLADKAALLSSSKSSAADKAAYRTLLGEKTFG